MASIFGVLIVGGFVTFMQLGVWIFIPATVLYALYALPWVTVPILCVYAALSYCDGASKNVAKDRTWPLFSRAFPVFKFMREYFPQQVYLAADIPRDRPFMLALHPHGSMAEFRVILDGQLQELMPSCNIRWLAASVLFSIPIIREMCLWTRCVDADRRVADQVLSQGLSMGVVPGGEKEQLMTTHGQERLYLSKRFGFVKLAIQHGVPLVPAYVFGCNDLYYTSRFLYGLRAQLVQSLGVCIPLCFGQFNMPQCPFARPVNVVLGSPVDVGTVEKGKEPSREQVAAAHAKYVAALQQLFDTNKAKFGFSDRTLTIE